MGKNRPEEMDVEKTAADETEETAGASEVSKKSEGKNKKEAKAAKALAEVNKELEETRKKLEEADKAAVADKDKYLRLYAEYDNYRKRSQKEREALYTDVKADTVARILPVYDNLSRALMQGTEDKAFLKGIEMTMAQLEDVLSKLGITAIESVGQPFDANKHEAVMHREDESVGENIVVQEFEKGFMLGEKVIRYSKVVVAN